MTKTIFDKLWDEHTIKGNIGEPQLLYIDVQLMHEVTSPQAFEGLRKNNRKVRRPDKTFATIDHVIPTINPEKIVDPIANLQARTLRENVKEFGISFRDIESGEQGVVHIIGPELGITKSGQTIVCGDSHTATHGALGNIAFGIGTSEVEHVLATQTLWQIKPKNMKIEINGKLPPNSTAKDIILYIIRKLGVGAGLGYAVEFCGTTIKELSIEERLTICNMAIEFGAKFGLIRADETTKNYLNSKGIECEIQTPSDNEAFDIIHTFDASKIIPQISWGTNPSQVVGIGEEIPDPQNDADKKSLEYTNLNPGQNISDINIGYVFIGSCTNGRIEDLIEASKIIEGEKINQNLTAIVVPGSQTVKKEAEKIGLAKIFIDAGFEWREPGCSMCLGMNPDKVEKGIHCASTSNRNFEGRQGEGSITHLCSPKMAAYASLLGHFPSNL